jgi:hypothetical protein
MIFDIFSRSTDIVCISLRLEIECEDIESEHISLVIESMIWC